MKKKFLKFIISMSLSLTLALGVIGGVAFAADTTISTATIGQSDSSTSIEIDTVDRSQETFDQFLTRAKGLDPSKLDAEFKTIYDKLTTVLADVYKQKSVSVTADELKVRTGAFWLTFIDYDYKDEMLPEIVKYLGLDANEITDVLGKSAVDYFTPESLEIFRLALCDNIFNPSTLTGVDKVKYDSIVDAIGKLGSDYTAEDIENLIKTVWSINTIDISKFTADQMVVILQELGTSLEDFIDMRVIILAGVGVTVEDVVKQVYEVTLLRTADSDGLKFWTSALQSKVDAGQTLDAAVDEMIASIMSGDEYKALSKKFLEQ